MTRFLVVSEFVQRLINLDGIQHETGTALVCIFFSFTPTDPGADASGQGGHATIDGYFDVIAVNKWTPEKSILNALFDLGIALEWLRPRNVGNVIW